MPRMNGAELESGQLVLNKTQCWEPLMLTYHMNEHPEFFYERCTFGDKDTYRLAWEYLGGAPTSFPRVPDAEDMVRSSMPGRQRDVSAFPKMAAAARPERTHA
jgi:hypothetical protein